VDEYSDVDVHVFLSKGAGRFDGLDWIRVVGPSLVVYENRFRTIVWISLARLELTVSPGASIRDIPTWEPAWLPSDENAARLIRA
jgi:hypothetical protein